MQGLNLNSLLFPDSSFPAVAGVLFIRVAAINDPGLSLIALLTRFKYLSQPARVSQGLRAARMPMTAIGAAN
jgi:hypothetical protein